MTLERLGKDAYDTGMLAEPMICLEQIAMDL
jgi:hypothetical protein